MFSVHDLLISHGYKRSKNPTNSSEDQDDNVQQEDTGRQSGQASRNGLPIHPGAIPKTNKERRYRNDDNYLVIPRRQKNAQTEDFSGPGNMQGGLYDQSQLNRSSHSKREKDLAYQRRQYQDFGAHGYPDRVDSETKGMAAACAPFEGENESQWETEGLENMRRNKQETMKPTNDYKRQSLKTEIWKQPIAFGRREPDTDNKERPFQDVYSGRRNIGASYIKNKPQSFPRQLSPESPNCAQISAIASSKQHKIKPELETLKYSEPATRPKYGRPLKPPSYEFHQHSRGFVETKPSQDEQPKRKTIFYVTKVDESDQDPTLEPPLYIPPPSYKSPGQQNKNQHVPEEVPGYDECFIKEMQMLEKSICISSESSVNQLQMEDEEQNLYGNKTRLKCRERQQSSVQYIPFNDPRIRHIKVIHSADHQMEDQGEDALNSTNIFYKNSTCREFNNSDVDVLDTTNIAVKCSQVSGSRRWPVESNADLDSFALSTQRSYDTANDLNSGYPKSRASAQSPGATDVSSEIRTKVKTFEPGTEIQGKNHLKKKTNETMFCLVSVPLQSEVNMPDSDRHNSVTSGVIEKDEPDSNRDLKDQSFLSTSSTDLELQALTGNMINTNILGKEDFQRPRFKQMNDTSCKQPPKHKELEYSGSWPCSRYKDQETQTSFREKPKIQHPLHGSQQASLHGSQLRKSNTLTNGHFLKYGSSTTESSPSNLPTDNRKGRPTPPPRKTQLNKTSKNECPKIIVNPKTGQNESRTTSTGLPGWKNEPIFAHKEEMKSPCSIKEAFGQFLLKPVSRRPWDAISELESFNKEIQKQEEKNEDNKENEQERGEDVKVKKSEEKAYRDDEVSKNYGCSAQVRKIKGTNKSKPESGNASKISVTRAALSDLSNLRSEAKEMDKLVKEKIGNNGLKQKQENAKKIIKQAIDLHPMKPNVSCRLDSEKSSKPFSSINSRESNVENHKKKDSDKLKRAVSVAPFSLKKRNQGRSESNLRSVGLGVNEGTSIPDPSTKEIPPYESLQARAARILGIEVAVESLTANNKTLPDEDYDCDNMAQSSELSKEKILRAEVKTDVASSNGKPKGGWSKSTFIGENSLGSGRGQYSGEEKLTRGRCFLKHSDLGKYPEGPPRFLESAALPVAETKSPPSNVEKKTRSTSSKVTVPRQGKVASAANRAAMDRLARMKEVDSVSRMRRLSIKNSGSGEDRDEEKQQLKEPEEKRNDSAVGRTEFPRRLSQGSCVSKRIISLNEKKHLGSRSMKKNERDLLGSEVYDPSRLERV